MRDAARPEPIDDGEQAARPRVFDNELVGSSITTTSALRGKRARDLDQLPRTRRERADPPIGRQTG